MTAYAGHRAETPRGGKSSTHEQAPAWDRCSVTLANIASAFKSGRFDICNPTHQRLTASDHLSGVWTPGTRAQPSQATRHPSRLALRQQHLCAPILPIDSIELDSTGAKCIFDSSRHFAPVGFAPLVWRNRPYGWVDILQSAVRHGWNDPTEASQTTGPDSRRFVPDAEEQGALLWATPSDTGPVTAPGRLVTEKPQPGRGSLLPTDRRHVGVPSGTCRFGWLCDL
jgi:hypothetical protein